MNPSLRAQYEQLGRSYLRLAEQAERNHKNDIVYETPARQAPQQMQQQQQIQPDPDKAED